MWSICTGHIRIGAAGMISEERVVNMFIGRYF